MAAAAPLRLENVELIVELLAERIDELQITGAPSRLQLPIHYRPIHHRPAS